MEDDLRDLIGPPPAADRGAGPVATPTSVTDPDFVYLPPCEPSADPVAAGSSPVRTMIVWLVLISLCIAIYLLFDGEPGHPTPVRDRLLHLAGVAWPFVLIAAVLGWIWRQFRGGQQLQERFEPGLEALADGQVDRAIETYRGVVATYARQPAYASVVRLHLALALARRGSLAAATDELIAIDRTGGLVLGSSVRTQAAACLAWIYGLRGDLTAADRWLAEADRRLRRAPGVDRGFGAAMRALAAVVVAARRGDVEGAARIFDAVAPRVEAALTVTAMKAGWLVRGFVAARWDGPRAVGAAEPWLRLIRGARPDEVDYVATDWPELQAFLASAR